MAGEEPRYEVAEIKAIRGTESKTITSKQQDGWELVTQQEGLLRITMTFRRPKPKPPWRLWAALGGAGVILAGIITAGALLQDDSDASATATATATATSPSTEQSTPLPAPAQVEGSSPSADPMICETTSWEGTCKFGQTAIYSDAVRSGDVRLEITVGAPVEFTPSEDAFILYDRPPQPVSVYFPVTIKNTSPDVLDTLISTEAVNAEQGGSSTQAVSDGDIGTPSVTGDGYLPVGESLSVKDGWTMATLDGVEYSLRIDGLAGYTIEFTR